MSDELQFDRADTPTPQQSHPACGNCGTVLTQHYFQAGQTMLCDRCAEGMRHLLAGTGSRSGRLLRAVLLGFGAALVGAIAYGLWMALSHSEFALVTIAIGWFVGRSVRKGSGGRGGWRYGIIAVLLTYFAISMSFLIAGLVELNRNPPSATEHPARGHKDSAPKANNAAPAPPGQDDRDRDPPIGLGTAVLVLVWVSLQMPVLSGMESILSLVITGFGLWQAWAMNRAIRLEVTGPHAIGAGPPNPAGA